MNLRDFYPFEPAEATALSLIPLRVRYKLDCAGRRLRLSQWQSLTPEEKSDLLRLPVVTPDQLNAYRQALLRMADRLGEEITPEPLAADQAVWRDIRSWPAVVTAQCEVQGRVVPPLARWQALPEHDRHALFVLARSHHSQKQFVAALALLCGG